MAKSHSLIGGHIIPSIGFGTWNVVNETELTNALDTALEHGYRHIDTAFRYTNEAIIGKVLKRWFVSGKLKREDVFITTKLPPQGVHPDGVEQYLTKSLEALQLDYVDLYLIHFPVRVEEVQNRSPLLADPVETDHLGTWKKMEEQVDKKRAKAIGVSNFTIKQIDRIWQSARIKPSCNQTELHPYNQQPELVKYCQEKKIVVVGYSSLGSGLNLLIERTGGDKVELPDLLNDETIKRIASKHGKSSAQVILRFFVQKNVVVIPKSIKAQRIKENFDLFSFALEADDVKSIESLNQGETARITNRLKPNPKMIAHPEYPFK